jgi:hypothetical protein
LAEGGLAAASVTNTVSRSIFSTILSAQNDLPKPRSMDLILDASAKACRKNRGGRDQTRVKKIWANIIFFFTKQKKCGKIYFEQC